jgi:hypothetical protein
MKFSMSRLEPGQRFVVKPPPGHIWVHEAVEPSAPAVPAPVAPSVARESAPPPAPAFTRGTRWALEAERDWLSGQPVEHATALYIDASGVIVGRSDFTDHERGQVMVGVSEIIRRADALGAAAVWQGHNHPNGSPDLSEADIEQKHLLEGCLKRLEIGLTYETVPATAPVAVQEAAPLCWDSWSQRVAAESTLWSCVGGYLYGRGAR